MALSALSHKRNRSACTAKTQSSSTSEPASKLSKLNAIFTKLTSSLRGEKSALHIRRSSLGTLLPFLRNDNDTNNNNDNNHPHHLHPQPEPQSQSHSHIHPNTLSTSADNFSHADSTPAESDDTECHNIIVQRRNSAFAADDLFERSRYQRMARREISCPRLREPKKSQGLQPPGPPPSILIRPDTPSRHRHTMSAQSAPRLSVSQKTHIRHGSHVSSSNITFASEHLTAKEFADIAGIQILPDEDDSQVDLECDSLQPLIFSQSACVSPSFDESDLSVASYLSVRSCRERQPQIWDTHFWRHPADTTDLKPRTSTTYLLPVPPPARNGPRKTKAHHRQTLSLPPRTDEPPIMGELRRMRTVGDHSHQSTLSAGPCVIRKGRFEIQLESSTGNGNVVARENSSQRRPS